MYNKFVYSANGTLSDLTATLRDYYNGSVTLTVSASQDYLYLGSKFPFTRKYLKVSNPNAVVASVTVSYWDGSTWRAATDVVDETAVSGVPLSQSGYFTFTPDKQYLWSQDDTTVAGRAKVTGLSTLTFYDMYWVRIQYSANVAATVDWIGDIFCTDNDLGGEHPDLLRANLMTAFKAGKTDWEEQRMVASELIVGTLKKLKVSSTGETLLSTDQLRRPTVSKTAQLIFAGLGKGYEESTKAAAIEYQGRVDPAAFDVDSNLDGMADPTETVVSVSRFTR